MTTYETITDDQIRELRDAGAICNSIYEFATAPCWYRRDYREQCARIWNSRAKSEDACAPR